MLFFFFTRSSLSGHWQGFGDPETDIEKYEWCLGYESYNCSITSFEDAQLSGSFIRSGLQLQLSVPLYLTVRATNKVGLQSMSSSDAFIVDDTIPYIVELPNLIAPDSLLRKNVSVQSDISLLRVSWMFEDQESPIVKHILTLKTHHQSNVSLEIKEIGAETSQILTFHKDNRLQNGDVYYLSVTACNQAGLCATAHSNDLLIDSTPPQLGGFVIPMTWENVQSGNTTRTQVNLTWTGFSDVESDITEYQIMVSRYYDGFELSGGIKYINPDSYSEQSTTILLYEQLHNGNSIILAVRAKNGVDLVTKWSKLTVTVISSDHKEHHGFLEIQRHSCDVHYCNNDCTCAVIGKVCEPPKITKPCVSVSNKTNVDKYPEIKILFHLRKDENRYYTPSTSCLAAEWRFHLPDSLKNIARFEWSMGLKDHDVGVDIFDRRTERIWHSTGRQQNVTYCLPPDKSLGEGEEYVVYVRVWYSYTEYKQFESPPVMIDSTPPHVRRGRAVKDSDETCVPDYDFMTRSSHVTACWGKVFQDSQSGIHSYTIQIGSSRCGTI